MKVRSLFLSLFLSTSPLAATTVIEDTATLPLMTPSLAEQETLKLRLDNGLEALIISDPNTDKSGALLSVQVGSWEDPEEHPGMAHFLEHMLFLGTKKYPDEGEYQRYIKDHGGSTNAFTTNHMTSYMFSVDNEAFDGALDRFSEFFTEPLFNPSGVSRELQAIDQEYAKNLENDDLRELFVLKALAKENHPYHRFNMGNSDTLKSVTRDDLLEWYQNHYSANLMRLMVVSPQPIDTLRDLVEAKFSDVPRAARERYINRESYIEDDLHGKMVVIKPIQDKRTLTLVWEMPAEFGDMVDSKPDSIICFVLGHEGEESLLAQLKRENLAESLSCGTLSSGAKKAEIALQIGLTTKGIHEINTIIKRVFQAINNFREQGYPEHLYEEIKQIKTLQYQYQQRQELFTSLMNNGMTITEEPMESYPEKTKIIQEYIPQDVKKLLQYMTPANAVFFLKAPTGTTNYIPDKEEPWLHVPYSIESIDQDVMKEWSFAQKHPNIDLPAPNPFIPESLDIVGKPAASEDIDTIVPQPKILREDNHGIYYWAQDTHYLVPKVAFHIAIKTPSIIAGDAQSVVMGDIYVKALNDALIKYSYPADMAGLKYKVTREDNGLGITIYGFSDKAPVILGKILEQIQNNDLDLSNFKTYVETLLRDYQNFSKESPLSQSFENLRRIIYRNYTTESEKATAIRKISLKKFKTFAEHIFDQTYIQSLLFGNIDKKQANELTQQIAKTLNNDAYPLDEQYKKEVIAISEQNGPYYIENRTRAQGNATILAVESLPFSFKSSAAQDILYKGMSEPFFSTLRTKQQTGYIVFNIAKDIERHLFNLFAVQSNTHNPRDLLARFELFIEGFLQELTTETLPESRFEKIKLATIHELENPAKNLYEMSDLIKSLAFDYNGDFRWMQKRRDAAKALTYSEFASLAKEMLGRDNHKRVGLLLKGTTPDGKIINYTKLRSANQLKKLSTYNDGNTGLHQDTEALAL